MILIVDDDTTIRLSLKLILERNEYIVALAENPKAAINVIRSHPDLELVLMDMNYDNSTTGDEGLTLLKQIKIFRPDIPCILMTAWGTIDLAVQGMRAGAFDFITKPWNNGVLLDRIETAIKLRPLSSSPREGEVPHSARKLCDESTLAGGLPSLTGGAGGGSVLLPSLASVYATISRIAPTNATVLITGESGTGKEIIAEAIHRQSLRAAGPFVKVNLGGISTSLFESEMFGHKKGSFTDAKEDRIGRFELAKGGTIFLDEIGELDIASQVKLLRVLQDQTYEVLGDSLTRHTDVRVICATNADLQTMVSEHTFREDLFYRINLIHLHLPPLRERPEDIPLLVDHFLRQSRSFRSDSTSSPAAPSSSPVSPSSSPASPCSSPVSPSSSPVSPCSSPVSPCSSPAAPSSSPAAPSSSPSAPCSSPVSPSSSRSFSGDSIAPPPPPSIATLPSITPDAIRVLQSLPFPGNIRELKNLVERTVLMTEHNEITADDIALSPSSSSLEQACPSVSPTGSSPTLEELERAAIAASIQKHAGNLSLVAKELGISRGALYRKIEKHGL